MFKIHNHVRFWLALLWLDGSDSGGGDSDSGGGGGGSSESANSASIFLEASADGANGATGSSQNSTSSPGRQPLPKPKLTDVLPDNLKDIPFRQDA